MADQEQVDRILGCDDFALADVPLEIGDYVVYNNLICCKYCLI